MIWTTCAGSSGKDEPTAVEARLKAVSGWLVAGVLGCSGLLGTALGAGNVPPRVLRIAYFVPSDRKPLPDRVRRLERVVSEVQRFYREGMRQNGYGPLTFPVDRQADGSLRMFQVDGRSPMSEYGRNDAGKVKREITDALTLQGLDLSRETVLVFQLLLEWRDGKAIELGPFVGGGGESSGMAWVYDDERLDPKLLSSKRPGGYYGRPCSIGEFNSHYLGGIAHELGHAFGLPHECERKDEREVKGRSLMGGGNHTYGQEQRREGRGSFLSLASAMMLSRHPLFAGTQPAAGRKTAECRIAELQAAFASGKLRLDGRLEAQPSAFGIIAYNDEESIPDDYDAVSWTSPVAKDGSFHLDIGQIKPGDFELRLRPCLDDGRTQVFRYRYTVSASGEPDTAVFAQAQLLQEAGKAYAARDRTQLQALLRRAEPLAPGAKREFNHLIALLDPPRRSSPAEVSATRTSVALSQLSWESAKTGWGKPLTDQVPAEANRSPLLHIGGEFFDSGLYAHAPALHVLRLGGKWKTFQSGYGLQDGHSGSVVFVVRGDGKELFRSEPVRDAKCRHLQVAVVGVDSLELAVEDAGDGTNSDWGVWVAAQLGR